MKSELTLQEATKAYLEHLESQGKKPGTLYTYSQDLKLIQDYFGNECPVESIRVTQVGKFYKSDVLLAKSNGKQRALHTVRKTVRVFLMMMGWLYEQGFIDTLPLPQKEPV